MIDQALQDALAVKRIMRDGRPTLPVWKVTRPGIGFGEPMRISHSCATALISAGLRLPAMRTDAYTPKTIPMERLAEDLRELAIMLGETKSVHFVKLVEGTLQIVHRVEREAVPKVEARLRAVVFPH